MRMSPLLVLAPSNRGVPHGLGTITILNFYFNILTKKLYNNWFIWKKKQNKIKKALEKTDKIKYTSRRYK